MFGEQFFPEIFINHWKKIGHTCSDAELAFMLHTFIPQQKERLAALQSFSEYTRDAALKQEILERISFETESFHMMEQNTGTAVFRLLADLDEDAPPEEAGLFSSLSLAAAHGTSCNVSYQIEKILLDQGADSPDSWLGRVHYDRDGQLLWITSSEYESISPVDMEIHSRFENRYYYIPTPFRRGDLVRLTGTNKVGLVSAVMGDDHLLSKSERERMYSLCDHFDVSVRVDFLGEDNRFYHNHIFPLFLEYAPPEESGLRKTLLDAAGNLLRGQGSLDYFQDLCLNAQPTVH